MMPNDTRGYDMMLDSQAWADLVNVLHTRKQKIQNDLGKLTNSRERDIELKARLDELEYVIVLPQVTKNFIQMQKEIEDAESMGRPNSDGEASAEPTDLLTELSSAFTFDSGEQQW